MHAERGTVQLVVGTEVLVEDELLLALRSASVPGDDCTECTAMALVAVTVGGETTLVDLAAGGLMAPQIDEQARTAEVAGWWLRAEKFGNGELTLTVDRTPPEAGTDDAPTSTLSEDTARASASVPPSPGGDHGSEVETIRRDSGRGMVQLVVGTEVLVEDELLLALRSASVPGDDCTECTAMALVAVTVGGETTLVDLAAGGLMAPQIDEQARTAEVAGWWLRAEEFGNGELTLTVDRTPPKG